MSNQLIPHIATHPGEILKDELNARGIIKKDFALQIDMQPTMLSEIINGKRSITADIAILLEKALDIPASYWMNFQSQYEIDIARIKEKNIKKVHYIEQWKIINQYVPVKLFTKFGYLKQSAVDDIPKIKEIYNIKTVDELVNNFGAFKTVSNFNYRKSNKLNVNEVNLYGWSNLVMWLAKKEEVDQFKSDGLNKLNEELQKIFYNNKNVIIKTKDALSKYGIKLVIQDKLDQTPVDGFSFWSSSNPAIGLTLRHKRLDNFAFTVFHELGHIALHLVNDKTVQFIDIEEKDVKQTNRKEIEADEFAQNFLIPADQWNEIKDVAPLSSTTIISFSKQHQINPAIVRGRVCWDLGRYNIYSDIDREIH